MFSVSWRCARHWVAPLVIALLVASLSFGGAQAAEGIAKAVKVRGEVLVTRGGADQPVGEGTAFQLRDTVKTGAKARVQIGFADGSIVTLAENSALSIDRFLFNPGASRSVTLSALSGIVNAVATKSTEAKFDYQVRTAQGYSAVRGTNWIIAVQNAISTFFVVEGLIEVGTMSGSRAVVESGSSVTISEAGLGAPQPIPPDVLNQLTDATDVESAPAAPAAPAAAPAPAEQEPGAADTDTPAPSSKPREKSGSGGGGGGGHGM